MRFLRRQAVGVAALWLMIGAAVPLCAQATRTQVRLILDLEGARPGGTVMAGVELVMGPKWHTYWRNGGDSGAPTEIEWMLPTGVTAGEILWPVPEKIETAGFFTYGYHGEVVLLVPLTLADSLAPGELTIRAKVAWLECEELCVEGEAAVSAVLTVGSETRESLERARLQEWQARLPEPGGMASAWWEGEPVDDERPLSIRWEGSGLKGDFFPYLGEAYEVGNATEVRGTGLPHQVGKRVLRYDGEWPESIRGLLVEMGEEGAVVTAREAEIPIGAAPPAVGGGGSPRSLPWVLVLAFVGGVILNIMPCVLPVISLKVLGFVNQARESPGRVKWLGMMYVMGVLASFLVLAGLVIGVQAAGHLASWGMQFQNPQFLVCMTVLVTLVALNLFGLFEVTLGGGVMGAASGLARREGSSGAFFNGVLATALATPCTAPFLATALGYAFTRPPLVILAVLVAVGAGLALPYLLLSWFPALLRFLPRPGPWMERFKMAMGFPLLATAVWLLAQLEVHYGQSGVLWIGLFLVTIALCAWIWGQFVQRGRSRRTVAGAIALVVLAGGYLYGMEMQLHWRSPGQEEGWQAWSPEGVEAARKAGRPILVDFTASWCLICQANKQSSIEIESVRRKLKEIDALTLTGDYSKKDDRITRELLKYERAGVPLVLVYARDGTSPPEVLPSVLTPGIVLDALDRAAR